MAGTPVDVGTGATIVFGTSSFTAQVKDIDWGGIARDSHETTHLSTSVPGANEFGGKTFIPGDLADGGEITMDIHFNPDTLPPINLAPEVVTVTWPKAAADTTASIWSASAFVTAYQGGAPVEELMAGSITVKIAGNVTFTAAT